LPQIDLVAMDGFKYEITISSVTSTRGIVTIGTGKINKITTHPNHFIIIDDAQ
jgi:hypothetical protein